MADATLQAVRDPLVVLDGALCIRIANGAFYQTFRVTPRDTEGKLIYELGAGEWDIPALRALLEEILPRDSVFNDFEVTHDFPTLGIRTMLVNGRRLGTADGRPDLILLGIEDITTRKRADEQLQQALQRFRLLAETVPDKIFTAKPSGERDYFNSQWLAYAGKTLDALAGSGWTELIHPDDRPETLRRWSHSNVTGEPYGVEHRLRRHDGQYRWHVTRAVALKEGAGDVVMWVGSCTDVHDVKEADRRKDEFIATLAHELRNPLAPLSAAVQLLHERDGEAGTQAIEIMHRQVAHMTRLVEQLIDVSRISRGDIDLRKETFELASVLNQAIDAARPHVESKQQDLTVTLPPKPIYLDADPTRIMQIVGNLLNNASKFTNNGGRIALLVESGRGEVVIRVRDNGIGIAEDQLPRIFDMFMQVDTSLERSQSGLGIGLTLAKRLVELHGGTIEARSAGLGEGSEFVVKLPTSIRPRSLPATKSVEKVAPRRVLLVDDNPDTLTLLAKLLERDGHEVHTAHDGLEAVTAAAEFEPDVVLLDVGLPKLNGYEAGRRIREQAGSRKLLLIALTGWAQDEDRRRSQEAGFDAHLVKPMDFAALDELLRTYR